MVWIVIALVLIAAVGPVFYLLPTKASRRQAALRTAARQAGLVVEIASVPKPDAQAAELVSSGGEPRDAKIDCAAYRLPLRAPVGAGTALDALEVGAGEPVSRWLDHPHTTGCGAR